ncbi:hypothetical protein KUTeg_016752 [Tegillarca granosa]|uniref:Uncharacterized protein n=1 Tax=Tegillarca granosa TaxID=220873 RepID=A0ABQ9ERM7_TEGGR|nr:hypothetical protein KUTeg_016752 [Tegillarca granosa]
MPDGVTQQMTLRTMCSPIPNGQGPPLTMDVDLSFKFPRTLVDPSQLLDPEYQQEIQRQIRILTQQHSEKDVKKSLDDIMSSQVSMKIQKLQSLSSVRDVIDQQVNNIIEVSRSSSNSEKQDLIKLAKLQKQLSKEAERLRQQTYDSRSKGEKVKKLEELVRKSNSKVKQVQLLRSRTDSSEQHQSPSSESCLQSIKQTIDVQNRAIAGLSTPSQQSQQSQQSLQSMQSLVQRVLDTYRSAESQAPCRSALLEQLPPYSAAIQRKLLEQLIQNEQIIQSLKQLIKDKMEESSSPQEQEALERLKKQIVACKEMSVAMSKSTSNLQSQNVDALTVSMIPASERSVYSKLQKLETKQVKTLSQLKQSKQDVDVDMQQKKRSLQNFLRDAESIQEELSGIAQIILKQQITKQKQSLVSLSRKQQQLVIDSQQRPSSSSERLEQSFARTTTVLTRTTTFFMGTTAITTTGPTAAIKPAKTVVTRMVFNRSTSLIS